MSKVKTPAGLTYVKDFSFPAAQGFSGSAGSNEVKGYMRGGTVKKAPVKKAKGGTTMRDGRDMHSQLYDQGMQMGFMRGGKVKKMGMPTSRGPQDTMDTGNQPARKGRNQAEIEAGGTKRMKPGYQKGGEVEVEVVVGNKTVRKSNSGTMNKKAKGGKVHSIRGVASSGGGALADAALKKAKAALRSERVMKKPEKAGTAASKKGMPKNVKMAGGMVRKARGGSVKK
mgnify:CR=1 FL=1